MKPLTPAEMRELHAKSTRGIWKARQFDGEGWHYIFTSHPAVPELARIAGADNAASIVAAHNNMRALLDRIEELEAIRVAAQDVLDCDGGHRSKCYHAAKSFDARERLFRLLATLPPQGETDKPGSKEGA